MAIYHAVNELTGASEHIAVHMTPEEFAAYQALPAPRPVQVTGRDEHGNEVTRMMSGTPTVEEAEQGSQKVYLVSWAAEI